MSVILGIDPGLTRCGFGVVESHPGRRVALVDVGVIRSDPAADIAVRVHRISHEVERLIRRHRPRAVSVERVFAQQNLPSVMGVAHIIGAVMHLAGEADIPLVLHTPSEVKAAVTGSGRADKSQVQHMVARLLGIDHVDGPPDAADALAVAICESFKPTASDTKAVAPAGETAAQRQWRLGRERGQANSKRTAGDAAKTGQWKMRRG
ncbi:crossover junction endodeoxyribonuclease RuvC [Pseudoclavibacter sp. CFCC 11306]|uniref:crossover junction endodeoxyribonuclease RuvC n=1 Tax=Pseudoclavibacter sp. CFCC 11306 TaxID=1564493 RepID=UPI00130179AA|nr:crossover junction endodeoxyribonuclease RuvC [Pseudoclavibacter sp. CFCC 11306]KAB1658213.1 crossover junction endodeoxyribonuclease RuvC [Pseudoclavibacter sp. CFCC 11306]